MNPEVKNCTPANLNTNASAGENLRSMVEPVVEQLQILAVSRGQALVQRNGKGKCLMCHSLSGGGIGFIPKDSSTPQERERARAILTPGLLRSLNEHLIEDKSMPPMSNDLSPQDREDIKAYIESFR